MSIFEWLKNRRVKKTLKKMEEIPTDRLLIEINLRADIYKLQERIQQLSEIISRKDGETERLSPGQSAAGRVQLVTDFLGEPDLEYGEESDLNTKCVHPLSNRYNSIDGKRTGCLACDEWIS